MNVKDLEKLLGITFHNVALIKQAFTHSSYVNEHQQHHLTDNERLEFLGDAVLELLISDYLYEKYPKLREGELTKLRASIVCEESLFYFSEQLCFDHFVLLGKGEERTGGRNRQALLADVFEAFLGALYIDQGLKVCQQFMVSSVFPHITDDVLLHVMDYKTALQEFVQEKRDYSLTYQIVSESGPAHDKQFVAEVVVNNKKRSTGEGKTKKEAEQQAAKQMYIKLSKAKKHK